MQDLQVLADLRQNPTGFALQAPALRKRKTSTWRLPELPCDGYGAVYNQFVMRNERNDSQERQLRWILHSTQALKFYIQLAPTWTRRQWRMEDLR